MEYFIKSNESEGDGTKIDPFSSLDVLFNKLKIKKDEKIDYKIHIYSDSEDKFVEISKAQVKKAKATYFNKMKKGDLSGNQKKEVKQLQQILKLKEDMSLPKAIHVTKLEQLQDYNLKRVMIQGYIQFIRKQSKKLWFINVKYRTKIAQCVFENELCTCVASKDLNELASIRVFGTINPRYNEDGFEIKADYYEIVQKSVPGGIDSVLNVESDVETRFDNRHWMIRGLKTSKIVSMIKVVKDAFNQFYKESEFYEVSNVPLLVSNKCEGGSQLFKIDYFGEDAYLSPTCQFYCEYLLSEFGNCYSINPSFRAEKSRTRRHLAQFTHVEAELDFITFDDLLNHIEDLLVRVSELVLEIDGETLLEINPDYKPLKKPFKRMDYKDAIVFLKENEILNAEGKYYEFGEDIPESGERKMLDIIGETIFITRFPADLKAFYMSKCADDRSVTESVDVLIPGVGEIVGGSMRITNVDELNEAYKREGIDPNDYTVYTDLRKSGLGPHGGYGLGFERFMTWMLNLEHIRDVCFFPRYTGRLNP